MRENEFGQPVGDDVDGWCPRPWPPGETLQDRWVRLEPLSSAHVDGLARAYLPARPADWTYVPHEPPGDRDAVEGLVESHLGRDWVTSVVRVRATGAVEGMLSLMRIDVDAGSIEIGSVLFGPRLQRTTASTAAQRLLMGHVLDDLG